MYGKCSYQNSRLLISQKSKIIPNYCFLKVNFLVPENLPYFFSYKTEFFSFQNKPKDLDPSYKMDVDLWDCLGRVKLVL